jgi:hypothetical protein
VNVTSTILRCIESYGFVNGIRESFSHIFGVSSRSVPSAVFKSISDKRNSRVYLYPAVMFSSSIDLAKLS